MILVGQNRCRYKQSLWVKIDAAINSLSWSRLMLSLTVLLGQDRCCHKQFWWVKIDVAIDSLGKSRSMLP